MFVIYNLFGQTSGSFRLGSQITNGITTGGCHANCVTTDPMDPNFICNPSGSNNHSVQTMTENLIIPSGNYLQLTIVTNACESTTDGLDSGDDFFVNGVQIVDGSGNTRVNYSGCFVNNNSSSIDIPLSFTANRRDETVTVNWTLNTTNPGGNCASAAPLPVKFNNFFTKKQALSVKLTFSTASETNNDYFTIERSGDGRNFESIGEIKGAGNSNQELSYEFVDESPLAGINYYRIKQTDFDGAFSYTEIRSVRHQTKNVIVSPNRTDGKLNVTSELDNYDVVIYNTGGQEVQRHMALSGDQSLSIETLQAGVYFVKVMDQTIRILKF